MQLKFIIILACLCLSRFASADQQQIPLITAVYLDERGYPTADISNPSQFIFSYSAYSPAAPLYGIESLENGKWTDISLGWCGTGVDLFELQPNAKISVAVTALNYDDYSKKSLRLVFRFISGSKTDWSEKTPIHTAYSSQIHLPLKPKG